MGGHGSGRRPNPAKQFRTEQRIPVYQEMFLPNVSNVQDFARKDRPASKFTAGSVLFADSAGGIAQDNANFFWDDSGNKLGIGTISPNGTLDVHTGDAGIVTPSTNADDLVIENSANAGMSILTPNTSIGRIFFGSPGDPTGAKIQWAPNSDLFHLGSSTANAQVGINSGNDVEALRIDASQNFDFKTGNMVTTGTLGAGASTLSSLTLTTDLTVANGGTGVSSFTDGAILLGSGAGAITALDATTKGNLVVGDGTTDPIALAVGTNDQVLTAASGEASGVKWAAAAGGGKSQITFSGTVIDFDNALAPYETSVTGTGQFITNGYANLIRTGTTADSKAAVRAIWTTDQAEGLLWDLNPEGYWSMGLGTSIATTCEQWVGLGMDFTIPSTEEHMGFDIDTVAGTPQIRASNSDGTTQKLTNLTFTVDVNDIMFFGAIMTSGTNIKYYIDSILLATVTDNLPSGVASQKIFAAGCQNTDGATTNRNLDFYEWTIKWDAVT